MRIVLWVTALTSSLIMLDTNIVAVALPSIAHEFHAGFGGIEWTISAYLVTFGSLLLPAGGVADAIGRRRAAMIGLALFLIASAICGAAPSLAALDAARALQGVGGSLLLTAALAIISHTFAPAERPRAYAFWGTCIGIAMTCGPIVGGLITSAAGWRWTFLVNIPLCAAFLIAMIRFVPESRDAHATHIDVSGVATSTLALFALTWSLLQGNRDGWTSVPVVSGFIAAVVLGALFVLVETRQTRPMIDLDVVRRRAFRGAAFGTVGYGAAAQVMIFFLPVHLQDAYGLSPAAAGFAMLPFAVPLFLAPKIGAVLVPQWSHRRALATALIAVALSEVLLALTSSSRAYVTFAIAMMLLGIATGYLNPETAKAVQAQIPVQRAGMGSGIGASIRFTSLNLGVAILGAALQSATGRHVGDAFAVVTLLAAVIAFACATAVVTLLPAASAVRITAAEIQPAVE